MPFGHGDKLSCGRKKRAELAAARRMMRRSMIRCNAGEDGRPARGSFAEIARAMGAGGSAASKLWREIAMKECDARAKEKRPSGPADELNDAISSFLMDEASFVSGGKGDCGRERPISHADLRQRAIALRPRERRSWRSLASRLKMPKPAPCRAQQDHQPLRRAASALKPHLAGESELRRLTRAIMRIRGDALNARSERAFKGMMDAARADEKRLSLAPAAEKRLLLAKAECDGLAEADPVRRARRKSHAAKITRLSAQARPRRDPARSAWRDGKIGFWAIGERKEAMRSSKSRPKGAELFCPASVGERECKAILAQKALPSAEGSWPRGQRNDPAFKAAAQHDGASARSLENGGGWSARLKRAKLSSKMRLASRPPSSPGAGINGLGLFRASQPAYEAMEPKAADDLMARAARARSARDRAKISRIFLALQSACDEIIKRSGGDARKAPRLSKEKMEREGALPVSLKAAGAAFAHASDGHGAQAADGSGSSSEEAAASEERQSDQSQPL